MSEKPQPTFECVPVTTMRSPRGRNKPRSTVNRLIWRKSEASELCGVTPRTLDRWAADGIGPARFQIGTTVFYADESLKEWLQRMRSEARTDGQ